MRAKAKTWLVLLPILILGAYLRFGNLGSVAAWYPDEGSNIAIAAALAQGEQAYLAFGDTSFINGHPHLFCLLLSGLSRLGVVSILWTRLLSATCGFLALLPTVLVCPGLDRPTCRFARGCLLCDLSCCCRLWPPRFHLQPAGSALSAGTLCPSPLSGLWPAVLAQPGSARWCFPLSLCFSFSSFFPKL